MGPSALFYNESLPVTDRILRLLFRIWRHLPQWVHVLGVRVVRPKYRVGVVALVADEQGRVLLFKHTYRKWEWGLPAGGLEYNEPPELAVVREFCEETGIQIRVERMLTALSSKEDHHISLVYRCTILGGEFRGSPEVSEMRYFDLGQLPPMLLAEKELIHRLAGDLER